MIDQLLTLNVIRLYINAYFMKAKIHQKGKKQTNCCSKTAGPTNLVNMKEAAGLRKKPGLKLGRIQ